MFNIAKRKKNKITKKNVNRKLLGSSSLIVILFVSVMGLSYLIFGSDFIEDKVNLTTASYISFNDRFSTDTMIIDKVKVLSENKGKKSKPYIINIKSDNNNVDYNIDLLSINSNIDLDYVYVYLTDDKNNVLYYDNLGNGLNIYNDNIDNNKKLKLRIWIDDNIKDINSDISFEVKVNLK